MYLFIYVAIHRRRILIGSSLNPGFHTFFEILGILLKIPSISNSMCEKPSISNFKFEIPGYSIEIQGFRSKY